MNRHRAARTVRPLAATVALLLVATLGAAAGGDPGASGADNTAGASTVHHVAEAVSYETKLITGDHIIVDVGPSGDHSVTVHPDGRSPAAALYQQYTLDGDLYVIPSDAAPLIPQVLDRELFNVTKLHAAGYTEDTPVIVQYDPGPRPMAAGAGLTTTVQLSSIDAVAATVAGNGQWWQTVTGGSVVPTQPRTLAQRGPLAGVQRVWLDEPVSVQLAESVSQVGAPHAWQDGYDGSGLRVAVLDTGVDLDHPDLAGQVVQERNFTADSSASDGHGHGTHVAGTVAGTGAASDGAYRGVAPGADILSGKVLDSSGNGQTSWVLAGMEWAAAHADVVNMSLGAGPTDGLDPVSLALNALSEQHGTLFVVSAGNSGPTERSVTSPGSADAALTVGSVDKTGALARSSSRGPRFGDWGIKPEVTAPGVGIVAPRAQGTAMGAPVNDDYTSAGGTSMAAPHVAGAAAILLQHDPTLTPEQLKSLLVTAANPRDGVDVYQQGGGLIDIPAALASPVLASPATLHLGHFEWPHHDVEPASGEVTFTNRGEEAITLDLRPHAHTVSGPPVPAGALTVEPATLTLAAGATGTATVTIDLPNIDVGLYSGHLLAEQDGSPVARVPLGFHKEDEMYDILITGVDSAGNPAGGSSNIAVLNVDDMTTFMRPAYAFVNGRVLARVPPGTYAILGAIIEDDERNQFVQRSTIVGNPELEVTGHTELVLDAGEGQRIEVDTPQHETEGIAGTAFGYWRSAQAPGPFFNPTWRARNTNQAVYAVPTDPVTQGEFEVHTKWRLAAPEAKASIVAPSVEPLDTYLLQAPAVDGEHEVPVVDLGAGQPDDFTGAELAGAAVLVSRHADAQYYQQQERLAAQAGAVALLVANDVPGHLTGFFADDGTIPVISVSERDGIRLRELLGSGEVRLRLSGTVWSDYLYDVMLVEVGHIPDGLRYVLRPEELATLQMSYHNDRDGHLMNTGRAASRPYHTGSSFTHPAVDGPRARTEYVVGGDMVSYQHTMYGEAPFGVRMHEPAYYFYDAGRTYHRSGFRQVVRPALLPHDPTTRSGDTLALRLFQWVDSAGMFFPTNMLGVEPPSFDTITTRVWRDGELITTIDGTPRGSVPMQAAPASYRVELDVSREADWWTRSTRTHTAWSFTSQRPAAGAEPVPMLTVDYELPLDLRNTVPHPRDRQGQSTLQVRVQQQDASLPAVAGARVWVSYDDGLRWQQRPVRDRGDGHFEVNLPGRPASGNADAVSVKVEAWDAEGNRVEQEVIRAWHLPGR